MAAYPTSPSHDSGLTSQAKLDLLHDTRQAFGRSALVLQGGAIFGLCHIGVVRALHLRGLLPRIIVGTATGALIAALVCVHTEDELLDFMTGERIDLSAFAARKGKGPGGIEAQMESTTWYATLSRRVQRFIKEGYFLDVSVLEECVQTNVGDMTFEEAYTKTRRVLNIMVPAEMGSGVPSLLNYLTAPNVVCSPRLRLQFGIYEYNADTIPQLIRSAAVASNATSSPLYHPVTLLCKGPTGHITPWSTTNVPSIPSRVWSLPANAASLQPTDLRDSPLSRVAELFNVNHFLVSQARPYIAPFLQTGDSLSHAVMPHSNSSNPGSRPRNSVFFQPLLRVIMLELQHRLRQLDALGFLNPNLRRFLLDEVIPGPSLTLVPELHATDFWRLLFERPTNKGVAEWILRGERSTWPAISALKVRCAVEVELDRAYQEVRRQKPMDAVRLEGKRGYDAAGLGLEGNGEKLRKRIRANSLSGGGA